MEYLIAKLIHVLGFTLLGGGLLGVLVTDLRSRQLSDLPRFSESVRFIRIFYRGFVFPGALIVIIGGSWMIYRFDRNVMQTPWLLGMIVLFAFEFIEGNAVTRVYFSKLTKYCQQAVAEGLDKAPELEQHRGLTLATFTHYLDLPLFFTMVMLGVLRPTTWSHFIVGTVISVALAVALTIFIPRLYPWPALSDNRTEMEKGLTQMN